MSTPSTLARFSHLSSLIKFQLIPHPPLNEHILDKMSAGIIRKKTNITRFSLAFHPLSMLRIASINTIKIYLLERTVGLAGMAGID